MGILTFTLEVSVKGNRAGQEPLNANEEGK